MRLVQYRLRLTGSVNARTPSSVAEFWGPQSFASKSGLTLRASQYRNAVLTLLQVRSADCEATPGLNVVLTSSNYGLIPYTANPELFRHTIAKLRKKQLLWAFCPSKSRWNTACQNRGRRSGSFDSPNFSIDDSRKIYVNSCQTRNHST